LKVLTIYLILIAIKHVIYRNAKNSIFLQL